MNIKKQLKEQRRKIDEQILVDGQQTFNELAEQYCVAKTEPKQAKRTNLTKWIAAVSCAVVACLVVGLSVGLTQPSNPDTPSIPSEPSDKEYFYQNEKGEGCTLEEFKNATNYSIDFGQDYSTPNIYRIYDSESLETLDYCIDFEHNVNFTSGELYVVVNKHFKFPEAHLGEIIYTKFGDYDMEYSVEEWTYEELVSNKYFGCITYNDYRIYFSFDELREGDVEDNAIPAPTVLEEILILK